MIQSTKIVSISYSIGDFSFQSEFIPLVNFKTEARMPKCAIEEFICTEVDLFWDYRSINIAVPQTFFRNHHFTKTASKTRLIGQNRMKNKRSPDGWLLLSSCFCFESCFLYTFTYLFITAHVPSRIFPCRTFQVTCTWGENLLDAVEFTLTSRQQIINWLMSGNPRMSEKMMMVAGRAGLHGHRWVRLFRPGKEKDEDRIFYSFILKIPPDVRLPLVAWQGLSFRLLPHFPSIMECLFKPNSHCFPWR